VLLGLKKEYLLLPTSVRLIFISNALARSRPERMAALFLCAGAQALPDHRVLGTCHVYADHVAEPGPAVVGGDCCADSRAVSGQLRPVGLVLHAPGHLAQVRLRSVGKSRPRLGQQRGSCRQPCITVRS
jgi:hypothetical protein